jgi:hypothetical protein
MIRRSPVEEFERVGEECEDGVEALERPLG